MEQNKCENYHFHIREQSCSLQQPDINDLGDTPNKQWPQRKIPSNRMHPEWQRGLISNGSLSGSRLDRDLAPGESCSSVLVTQTQNAQQEQVY